MLYNFNQESDVWVFAFTMQAWKLTGLSDQDQLFAPQFCRSAFKEKKTDK